MPENIKENITEELENVTEHRHITVSCCVIDLDNFMDKSPIPLSIRIRMELNKKGIKFVDDGLFSAIINENPEPLGIVELRTEFDKPNLRFYRQILYH